MPTRTEGFASTVMGAVKSAKATVEGLRGVFKKLTQEHGEVTALLLRVKASSDEDLRRDLFPKIRAELLAHESGERSEVYPVFRQHPELEKIAADHDREATELEQMLDQLDHTPVTDPSWGPSFEKLVELVSHHTHEEENDYFPEAMKVLGDEEAERLLEPYEQARARLLAGQQPS